MSDMNTEFLRRLKKEDEVFVVTTDSQGRKSGQVGRVIARGPKWVTVTVPNNSRGSKFCVETGEENCDCGYSDQLWENEAAWMAHVERAKAWEELRQILIDHREPPANFSLSDIKSVTKTLGLERKSV